MTSSLLNLLWWCPQIQREIVPQGWRKPRRVDGIHSRTCWNTQHGVRGCVGCEGETATTTLSHEFAELSDEFVQNLRRNLRGLFSTQVYDSMGQIHHEPMVTSSLFFAKLSGKSVSHFCYMAVDLKNHIKNGNSVEKLDLPSHVSAMSCQYTFCVHPSRSFAITIVTPCLLASTSFKP